MQPAQPTETGLDKDDKGMRDDLKKGSDEYQKLLEQANDQAISADEREIATNVAFLKRRYPDRDASSFRRTAEAYIVQEKIFKLFEPEQKKETSPTAG